jgi:phosphohistidine phosphatase
MKTLLLIRHAKSSWENFAVTDEERPLNARGKKNAPEMAKRLRKKHITIDAFLSSSAKRAQATAEYFTEAYGVPAKSIVVVPELYLANADAFTTAIRNAPPAADTVALFSHNDGITLFANRLSDAKVDNMPTCAVFAVKCDIREWSEFMPRDHEFYFFDYPKSE